MLKRFLLLIGLVVLVVACGSKDDNEVVPTVVVVDSAETKPEADVESEGAVEVATDEKIVVKYAVSDFEMGNFTGLIETFEEENPNIEIKLVSEDELLGIDPTSGAFEVGDDGPEKLARGADVVGGNFSNFDAGSIERGLILDLAPFIESDSQFNADDFYPNVLQATNGQIATLPLELNFNLIYYDKEKFDAAGISYPESDWSWEDLRTTAKALTLREGSEVVQWGFAEGFRSPIGFVEGALATPIIDRSTDPPTVRYEDADVEAAVRWYTDLYVSDESAPYFEQNDNEGGAFVLPEGFALIEDGKAAMWTEFSGSFSFRNSAGNLGAVPYPNSGDVVNSTPVFISGLSISAGTGSPNAAWKWVSFLSGQERPGFGFGGRTALPARRSVAEGSGFWNDVDEELGAALEVAVNQALVTEFREGYSQLETAVSQILNGDKSVEDALAEAQDSAETAINDIVEAEKMDAFSVIASKEEEAANPDAKTIKFVAFGAGFDLGQYRDLAAQFTEQNPEYVVEIRPPDFSGQGGAVQITMADIAQTTDCFQTFSEVQSPDNQAAVLTIDPFIEADASFDRDDFFPALLDQFSYQGQLWGVPAEITPVVLEYNKDLFDESGVVYPENGWSLDQFVNTAIDLTEGDGEFKTYGFVPDAFEMQVVLLMVERLGATLVDDSVEPATMAFNDQKTIDALRWYADLHTNLGVKPVFINDPADFSGAGAFADREGIIDEGRAGMWTDFGQGGGGLGLGDRSTMNLGVVAMPKGVRGAGGGFTPAGGYFISAETQNRQGCWEWIKFLTQSPDVATGLPARKSVAESQSYRNSVGAERADAYLASLEDSAESSVFRLFSGENDWMGNSIFWLGRAHQQVIDGELPVEEALDEAQRVFDEYRACIMQENAFDDPEKQNECLQETDPTLPSFLTGG